MPALWITASKRPRFAVSASLHHLHHESDEVAWVIAGEMAFKIGDEIAVGGPGTCAFMPRTVPHAWKNTGSGTARDVFLYTPAGAGGYIEEMSELPPGPMSPEEPRRLCQQYRWEILGPIRFSRWLKKFLSGPA